MRKAPPKPALPEGVEDYGPLQRKFWAAQRVAWIAFSLILIACLLGAFGRGGYLSRSIATSANGSTDFPVITRWNAPDDLVVSFAPSPADRTFFVDDRFYEVFSVETVDPPQKAVVVRDGMTGYVFPGDTARATRATFRLKTQSPSLRTMTFGVDGETGEHSIFIFP